MMGLGKYFSGKSWIDDAKKQPLAFLFLMFLLAWFAVCIYGFISSTFGQKTTKLSTPTEEYEIPHNFVGTPYEW